MIRKCLAKDPDERFQNARDLKYNLGLAMETTAIAGAGKIRILWIAATVMTLVAGVLGFGLYRATRPAGLNPLLRLDVDPGAGVVFGSSAGTDMIVSPDGTRLVYVSQGKLFTRRLDQPAAIELANTEGAFAPFFSPDGQWVAYFSDAKLKKNPVDGGAAVTLCDTSSSPRGGSWGEDGNIVAALGINRLSLISSAGGAPSSVMELAQGDGALAWPQILPGGKAVLFTSARNAATYLAASIEVMSLADHRRLNLHLEGTFARYLPAMNGPGHLIYTHNGTLFAVPFDAAKLELRGKPSPVLEEVAWSPLNGSAQFDFSRNGTLLYRSGGAAGTSDRLVIAQWLDGSGGMQPLLAKPGLYERLRLSPDGERVALDLQLNLWVYEARRDTMTRLTPGIGPVWSPDGRYILFVRQGAMRWIRSDGAGQPHTLLEGNQLIPASFTADGKRLAYQALNPGTAFDIMTVTIESDGSGLRAGKPEIFLQTAAEERHPAFSPNGRWLAYESDESGKPEVYVRAFPDKGGKWQISNAGGMYPNWSGNGHEMFFRSEDDRIMVAEYTTRADSFVPDKPRLWSDKRLASLGPTVNTYDPAPDGKRIAALMPAETPETRQKENRPIFLLNFADEVQRKAPAGK